jgi:TDG/mug DNA glycosylase family protein
MSAAKELAAEGAATAPPRLHGLAPVVAADARVLVLGSFPSAASLAAQQYYAHTQNRFWLFMGQIFGDSQGDWRLLPYERRLRHARDAGVAIWDIYGSCERSGSLDAAIRNPAYNDFAALLRRAPAIKRVCFNGATAARAIRHLASFGLETIALPSTSPANASQAMDFKLARWRAALSR